MERSFKIVPGQPPPPGDTPPTTPIPTPNEQSSSAPVANTTKIWSQAGQNAKARRKELRRNCHEQYGYGYWKILKAREKEEKKKVAQPEQSKKDGSRL